MRSARVASVALLLAVLLLPLAHCRRTQARSERRVIVLGVDGLDPAMVRERIDRGILPTFARLAERGMMTELGTTWPPQSPVAWTSFATGVNPGKHGLFDFIHLDRETYGLLTSMTVTKAPWLDTRLGGCVPLQLGASMERTRAFPAFWDVLADAGVPVAVYRIPADFPVESESDAVVFPDMGTTDVTGAAAGIAFLWFERGELADARGWTERGGTSYEMQAVTMNRSRADARGRGVATAFSTLVGPPDGEQPATTPVQFYVDTTAPQPVMAADVEGKVAIAPLGDWSDWVPVTYKMSCGIDTVSGFTRFFFVSAEPFAAYAAPVQIDPWDPIVAVSSPKKASAGLADAIGPYYTQGFPDAYKAYKVGMLDTAQFISESDTVLSERMDMLRHALDGFDGSGGLLFFYTGALDMRCHMLWHLYDRDHPHREPAGTYAEIPSELRDAAARYGLDVDSGMSYEQQIDRVYMQVDGMLAYLMGEVERRWPETDVMVISDHGFSTMRRVMNVNDWLVREGYLVLKSPGATGSIAAPKKDGKVDWSGSIVDWQNSVAFSVGFNGITLNRRDREPQGIVDDVRATTLLVEMQRKLVALRDADGTPVFTRVLPATSVFQGAAVGMAPDLQLGFNRGYGASDPSAEGDVTGEPVIVPNDSRWSGSHLMDPDLVKGTLLLAGRTAIDHSDPTLEDVTATLYQLFSVVPPDDQGGIDGRPLYR